MNTLLDEAVQVGEIEAVLFKLPIEGRWQPKFSH